MTESNQRGEDASTEAERASNADDERESYVRELQQYRRRLDGAMFAGDLAWWEMDVETGSVTFHENKADMLGYSPDDFDHYEDFTDLVHPDDHDRAMQAMRDHLEGKAEKYDVEYRIRRRSGEYAWFHDVGGVTERAPDGAPEKVTGVVIDITRRRHVELDLRERNDQLSLLNRIIRHDIRNDMSVIEGWIEVLRDELPPEHGDRLDRIRRASRHTTELTEEVRDLLVLLDDDHDDLELDAVDLGRVVEGEVERVRDSFSDVEIEVDDLPSVEVRANAMLSSVFGNLLSNAVQHADEAVARITVETDVRAETVALSIADDGPGIPADRRRAIFEQDEKGLDSEGTGLGLFLVKTLVDAYGGSVDVTDNDPKGSVFTVELQRADAA